MVPFQVRKYGPEKHELRLGWASWDEDRTHISVKYTWFDKRGHGCRGGEVPIRALPQMLAMAIQSGLEGARVLLLRARVCGYGKIVSAA